MSFDITREVLTKNIGLKIISFFIAIMLWLYVISITNPMVERQIELPVIVKDLNTNLVIKEGISQVKVIYRGKRKEVINNNHNIFAYIDLKGYEDIGHIEVPVRFNNPEEYEIVQTYPEKLSLVLKNVYSSSMKIEYDEIPKTGYYFEYLSELPEKIELRGDKDIVMRALMSKVHIDLTRLDEGEHDFKATIDVLDHNFTPIQNIKVIPENINVNVKITKFPTDEKFVKPQIIGNPEEGYEIFSINVNPAKVSVEAHPDILYSFDYINTENIDVSGRKNGLSTKIKLVEKNDIKVVKGNEVEVTISIQKKRGGE